MRKWKPSKSQKRAFAIKMQDPVEREAYEQRKKEKADKRRSTSQFDYESAGGNYIPTKFQHDCCVKLLESNELNLTTIQRDSITIVIYGYFSNDKVPHDNIHIVNELIRSSSL